MTANESQEQVTAAFRTAGTILFCPASRDGRYFVRWGWAVDPQHFRDHYVQKNGTLDGCDRWLRLFVNPRHPMLVDTGAEGSAFPHGLLTFAAERYPTIAQRTGYRRQIRTAAGRFDAEEFQFTIWIYPDQERGEKVLVTGQAVEYPAGIAGKHAILGLDLLTQHFQALVITRGNCAGLFSH